MHFIYTLDDEASCLSQQCSQYHSYYFIQEEACLFFKIFIYLLGYTGSKLWHVGSSSLTKDGTWTPCIGNLESQSLDHPGSPGSVGLY